MGQIGRNNIANPGQTVPTAVRVHLLSTHPAVLDTSTGSPFIMDLLKFLRDWKLQDNS